MSKLRFGIIACSSIASRRFIPALLKSENAELVYIGSRNIQKAKEFADKFKCKNFGTYEDVLRSTDVDAVYISTPITEHLSNVLAAAKSGKHILCEKQAFISVADAEKAIVVCRENKVALLEAYMFRFHTQHDEVKKLIKEGVIGEPRYFEGIFTYPFPPEGDIRYKTELCGGVEHDSLGYPLLAAMNMFECEPTEIQKSIHFNQQLKVDVSASMQMKFKNSESAQIYVGMGLNYRSRYSMLGSKGRIEVARAFAVNPDQSVKINLEINDQTKVIEISAQDQFLNMIDYFSNNLIKSQKEISKEYENIHRLLKVLRS